VSQLCSSAGESLAQIAMPLFVFSLTGSARMVGFMALVLILPRVVLSPITGLLADRLGRNTAGPTIVSHKPTLDHSWRICCQDI
jgi:MFS family permease